jgi:hypothetical protein
MEAHPGELKVHPPALEARVGAVGAHPGAVETFHLFVGIFALMMMMKIFFSPLSFY